MTNNSNRASQHRGGIRLGSTAGKGGSKGGKSQKAAEGQKKAQSEFSESVDKMHIDIPGTGNDPSKGWEDQFHIEMTIPDAEFTTVAKDTMYKLFDSIVAKKEGAKYTLFTDEDWTSLLTTYVLQELSEDKKMAAILTDENKAKFEELIKIFIKQDEFRVSILDAIRKTAAELNGDPIDNEPVHLITQKILVNPGSGEETSLTATTITDGKETITEINVDPAEKPSILGRTIITRTDAVAQVQAKEESKGGGLVKSTVEIVTRNDGSTSSVVDSTIISQMESNMPSCGITSFLTRATDYTLNLFQNSTEEFKRLDEIGKVRSNEETITLK